MFNIDIPAIHNAPHRLLSQRVNLNGLGARQNDNAVPGAVQVRQRKMAVKDR
jgi:hypothetical protein